jgi:hypothetical protein
MSNMRGFPLVGRGMTGAIPGTDPVQALLAKESREERKRDTRNHFALEIANHRLRAAQLRRRSDKEA